MLKKYKYNGQIEFAPVYFNSVTRTVINHKFRLEKSFQEILYMIDVWINNCCGWIVESIESQYINISTYRPLSGSSHMELLVELKSPRKELIIIKNKDQKCFLWCRVSHINPSKEHPERISKIDKKNLLSILLIQKKFQKKIKSLLVILILMELSFLGKKNVSARLR